MSAGSQARRWNRLDVAACLLFALCLAGAVLIKPAWAWVDPGVLWHAGPWASFTKGGYDYVSTATAIYERSDRYLACLAALILCGYPLLRFVPFASSKRGELGKATLLSVPIAAGVFYIAFWNEGIWEGYSLVQILSQGLAEQLQSYMLLPPILGMLFTLCLTCWLLIVGIRLKLRAYWQASLAQSLTPTERRPASLGPP